MNKAIEDLLNAMEEIVNDSTVPWKDKRDRILGIVGENERWDSALEEFVSWFAEAA